ncbi:MAG: preprotein translocase subunit Sec61beta [Candidatus Diapherotrites archaeon]
MVKLRKGRAASSPSSTIGLMRFFDAESKAPKISPQFVLLVAIAIAVIWIIALKFFG